MRHEIVNTILKRFDFPAPHYNYPFHPQRGWRFAFAWPEEKVAIDVLDGHPLDVERYIEAQLLGWRVLPMNDTLLTAPGRIVFYLRRAFHLQQEEVNQP